MAGELGVNGRSDRLWVLWGEPKEGRRRKIGELWRDAQGYAFAYVPEVQDARAEGFGLLPEFPELRGEEAPYRTRYLFATFAQRVPSPRRPDFNALMATWGVINPDDPFEILAASGGVQMTDRIELAEHRADDDDLSAPLFIRVAGTRYYAAAEQLQLGLELQLAREPENPEDEHATMLRDPGGRQIGYVPRQYSRMVARALDAGYEVQAVAVRWQNVPASPRRLVVRINRMPEDRNGSKRGPNAAAAIGG